MTARSDHAALDKWLGEVRGRGPLAVILGGSSQALIYSRSLGRRGVPTLMLESQRTTGMYTKYGMTFLLPPLESQPERWLAFLECLAERVDEKPILFPTGDDPLLFLARNRARVEEKFRFIVPDSETIEQIANKRIQYSVAEKAGILVPKTFYPESLEEVRDRAPDLSYPVILKPYMYRGKKSLGAKWLPAHTPAELLKQFGVVRATGHAFMVQEFIPGPRTATFAYHAFVDRDGHEIAWWTKRHLRGTATDGSAHVTVEAPEVAALGRRFLAALRYKGFAHVEFKLDSRDGSYKLMEINARSGLSSQQGIAAGVDLPWLGYQYLQGALATQSAPTSFKTGVTYVHEQLDFGAFLRMRKTGELRFLPWLLSVLRADAKAIWAWDDPAPFFMTLWKLTKAHRRNISSRRAFPKARESVAN